MHQSSWHIMAQFREMVDRYCAADVVQILDVGSYGVNGTYKEIFVDATRYHYTGLDLTHGPNVDFVPRDPYQWSELEDESYDVIISGQAFEHIEFPWLIILEMEKKLKQNGLICIIAPSRGPEHKYPVDCWRYYPDGLRALAKWAGLEVLDTGTYWGTTGFSDGSDQWGDTFCIMRKGSGQRLPKQTVAAKSGRRRPVNKNNPLGLKSNAYYGFAREEALNAVLKHNIGAERVLEIGCASGATGKRMKEVLPIEYYAGIEMSEEAADIARRHLDRVISADIEAVDLHDVFGAENDGFDLILAMDVLEHLNDPWDTLASLSQYLKPGGYVVASIPNVQNITIINDLIKGKWRYEEAGLLDVTHLRFFTLEALVKMFEGAGLQIEATDHILNPVIDVAKLKETSNDLHQENISIANLTRQEMLQLFTYQYLVIAKKANAIPDSGEGEDAHSAMASTCLPCGSTHGAFRAARQVPSSPAGGMQTVQGLVSIVILTFNQLEYTKECVKSIKRHTPQPHEIVFVDNGSTDGTVQWLRQHVPDGGEHIIIENGRNLGFAKGCNQGIEASSGEYVLLLNNDVVVTENWLAGLLDCLKHAPDAGIVGPMTNNISGPQKAVDAGYGSLDRLEEYACAFRDKYSNRRIPLRRIVGFCMLFRRTLVEKIGLLDERFGSGNFEDDDYCLRAALEGFKNYVAGDVFIHHHGSVSFVGNKIDYGSAMAKNRDLFSSKWGRIDAEGPLGDKILVLNTIESADLLYQQGQLDKAVDTLLEAVKFCPNDSRPYHALAEILLDAELFRDALDALTGMQADIGDIRTLELAGRCHAGLGQFDQAEEYAGRVLSLNPASPAGLNLKGLAAFKKGRLEEAENLFNEALLLDKGLGETYTNLGMVKDTSCDREKALDLLERGFILSPTVGRAVMPYYSAITGIGELERAAHLFLEAKTLYPRNKRLNYLYIDILVRNGSHAAAMKEMEESMMTFGMDDAVLSAALELRSAVGPKEVNLATHKRGTVSLCMIVKEEAKNIGRCLASAGPVVDEMIVVDTGSTDRTRDIARAFGAKVYDFEWSSDFAEARNFSLSKAAGDWVFVLDADEVLSPLDHGLFNDLTKKKPASQPAAYLFVTRNYVIPVNIAGWTANDGRYIEEQAGSGWHPSPKVRLFPNRDRIRFENPIHELVEPSLKRIGIPVRECGIPVHHYGYLDKEKTDSKREAYYRLGEKKLLQNTDDAKALYEHAIQAMELGKYEDAVGLWNKLLAVERNFPTAYMSIGTAYLELGRFEDAVAAARKAVKMNPDYREAAYTYALGLLCMEDAPGAITVLETLLKKYPEYPPAMDLLYAAYCCARREEQGQECLRKLQNVTVGRVGMYPIVLKLIAAGRLAYAIACIETARANNAASPEMLALMEECYRRQNDACSGTSRDGGI